MMRHYDNDRMSVTWGLVLISSPENIWEAHWRETRKRAAEIIEEKELGMKPDECHWQKTHYSKSYREALNMLQDNKCQKDVHYHLISISTLKTHHGLWQWGEVLCDRLRGFAHVDTFWHFGNWPKPLILCEKLRTLLSSLWCLFHQNLHPLTLLSTSSAVSYTHTAINITYKCTVTWITFCNNHPSFTLYTQA